MFPEIQASLRDLYLSDTRPWLVGFSGRKDSTMVAGLIFEVQKGPYTDERSEPICILCTDAWGGFRFGCWTCIVSDYDKAKGYFSHVSAHPREQ